MVGRRERNGRRRRDGVRTWRDKIYRGREGGKDGEGTRERGRKGKI